MGEYIKNRIGEINREVQLRNMFGMLKNLFNVVKDSKAVDFRIFNTINTYSNVFTTGIAILTGRNKFIMIKDVYDPKLQQFPDISGKILILNRNRVV